jgi:very-short-patch-repair endonuclease
MPTLITNGRCIPYDPDLVDLARALRKNQTPEENKLWVFLKSIKPRFLRQRPLVYYIADFYCPSKKLVIEIDGNQHQTDFGTDQDIERTKILNGFGIRVIRFSNHNINQRFDQVCNEIMESFSPSSQPPY